MKNKLFILAISAIAFASCAKEAQPEPQPQPQPEEPKTVVSFDATAGDCTRTVLTDGVKTYWQNADAISIFDGTSNNSFTTTLASPAASASFTGKAAVAATYYAVYPYNASSSLSGSVVTTALPSTQYAVAGSFDPKAELLACKTSDNTLAFKPAVAILKVDIGTEGAVSATVSANGSEGLAGTTTIDLSSALAVSAGNESSVKLVNSDSQALATGVYYIAVLPGTLNSGLTITLTNASAQTITKSTSDAKNFVAGTIYNMGTISGSWQGDPSTELVLFDENVASGWKLDGTTGKWEISTDYATSGTKSIKWTVDDSGSWARQLTLGLSDGSIDVSKYSTLSFKMKLVGTSTTEKQTFARIQVVDANKGYTEVNLYSDVTDWTTVSFNLSDFSSTDMTKLENFCFYTPGWFAVTTTVYFDEIKLTGATPAPEPTSTKIFTDSMQNGWKLGGTTGKVEICAEAACTGTNGIKWTVDDNASWQRVLTLEPANAGTDVSTCTAIRFKMKFVNSTCTAGNTVFQNRVYGADDAESFYNVYAPADDEWQTVTMNFSDFTTQKGSDIWTKLNTFCFHTTGWFAGTATIYFDDIELVGTMPGPEPEESLVLFDENVKAGWALGGTEGKYSISTDYASSGTNSIKWLVDSYGSWSRTLTLGLSDGSIDVSGYSSFSFKMKLVDTSTTEKQTFAQIQVVDANGGYSAVNLYSDVTDWTTVSFSLSDFSSTDMTKLKNFCFYTPGWYAVTTTAYIDEVKFTK